MENFYQSHIYLFSLIIGVIIFLISLIIFYKYRKSVFIAGALAIPQGFYSLMLVPGYWNPSRVMVLGVGVEDLLFSFLAGSMAWVGVLLLFQKQINIKYNQKQIFKRYLMCTAIGIFSTTLLYLFGIKNMVNPFVTMCLIVIIILYFNRKLWPLFIVESIFQVCFYFAGLKSATLIWPKIFGFWTQNSLWGLFVGGIPLEELVWAFLYGGSWSLAIAFILDVDLKIFREKSFK